MGMNSDKSLHIITLFIIIFSSITSAVGLFYTEGGKTFNFVNQYGDNVKMCGRGLYAHDSFFMAPIFRGTDFIILLIVIPLLILALVQDIRKRKLKNRLFLISVISVLAYYSSSLVFGVTYNILDLVYIALFSSSIFGLIIAAQSIDKNQIAMSIKGKLPYKAIYIFLAFTGVGLIVAWLPDIIKSLILGRSLDLIEVYTTQITYVLDMGIIAPTALICLVQLKKRKGLAYILLAILLTLCSIIGIILPSQTVFQILSGISFHISDIITKVVIFVILAFFALYFNIKLFKSINQ